MTPAPSPRRRGARAGQALRRDTLAWRAKAFTAVATRRPGLIESAFEGLPMVGAIDGRFHVPDAVVSTGKFGPSEGVPFVLEIDVGPEDEPPADVGRRVRQTFFPDRPPLQFNVCFSCGKPRGLCRTGSYGDPLSIWFNVFFGYYEINVTRREWGRPFGYRADGTTLETDDVLRIGKSDWNYFSNWLYGVPESAITPNNGLDGARVTAGPRQTIGHRLWDVVDVDDAQMVSAYVSGARGDASLEERGPYSFLWRSSFGFPRPRAKELPDLRSFFPVKMKARLYMSWRLVEDDPSLGEPTFQTYLFGGTCNQWWGERRGEEGRRLNAEFLDAQLAAVQRVLRQSYPDLGFEPGR